MIDANTRSNLDSAYRDACSFAEAIAGDCLLDGYRSVYLRRVYTLEGWDALVAIIPERDRWTKRLARTLADFVIVQGTKLKAWEVLQPLAAELDESGLLDDVDQAALEKRRNRIETAVAKTQRRTSSSKRPARYPDVPPIALPPAAATLRDRLSACDSCAPHDCADDLWSWAMTAPLTDDNFAAILAHSDSLAGVARRADLTEPHLWILHQADSTSVNGWIFHHPCCPTALRIEILARVKHTSRRPRVNPWIVDTVGDDPNLIPLVLRHAMDVDAIERVLRSFPVMVAPCEVDAVIARSLTFPEIYARRVLTAVRRHLLPFLAERTEQLLEIAERDLAGQQVDTSPLAAILTSISRTATMPYEMRDPNTIVALVADGASAKAVSAEAKRALWQLPWAELAEAVLRGDPHPDVIYHLHRSERATPQFLRAVADRYGTGNSRLWNENGQGVREVFRAMTDGGVDPGSNREAVALNIARLPAIVAPDEVYERLGGERFAAVIRRCPIEWMTSDFLRKWTSTVINLHPPLLQHLLITTPLSLLRELIGSDPGFHDALGGTQDPDAVIVGALEGLPIYEELTDEYREMIRSWPDSLNDLIKCVDGIVAKAEIDIDDDAEGIEVLDSGGRIIRDTSVLGTAAIHIYHSVSPSLQRLNRLAVENSEWTTENADGEPSTAVPLRGGLTAFVGVGPGSAVNRLGRHVLLTLAVDPDDVPDTIRGAVAIGYASGRRLIGALNPGDARAVVDAFPDDLWTNGNPPHLSVPPAVVRFES